MSKSDNSGSSAGIGLAGAVFVVLLVLKIAEVGVVATWSWWWVTAPLWAGCAVALAALLVFLTIKCVIVPIVDGVNRRARMRAALRDD